MDTFEDGTRKVVSAHLRRHIMDGHVPITNRLEALGKLYREVADRLDALELALEERASDSGIVTRLMVRVSEMAPRLDALEKVTMTDEQVRRVVGTALVDHMVEEHAGADERLDDLEERIGKLETSVGWSEWFSIGGGPISGQMTQKAVPEPAACPVCGCYADHDVQCRLRPKPEPAAPKPASTLVAQVRDVFDAMYRALAPRHKDGLPESTGVLPGTNAYAQDAIRAVAEWLERNGGNASARALLRQLEP